MNLADLVQALLDGEALIARQWVADASRARLVWAHVPRPTALDATAMALAAGVAELLASRAEQAPPAWAAAIPAAPAPVFLVRAAAKMPRLRHACETESPEPLRRRQLFAPADFLTAA